jgi:hypothetical protein
VVANTRHWVTVRAAKSHAMSLATHPSRKAQQMKHRMNSGVVLAASGMLAVLAGRKRLGIALFAAGCVQLELRWRRTNPEFQGNVNERWVRAISFYRATHKNPVNRWLHIVGIPMIAAGTAGLIGLKPFRPAWAVAAGAFTGGWALNLVGHAVYERKAPAFQEDPLSFIAGPVWDLQQLFRAKPNDASGFDRADATDQNQARTNAAGAFHTSHAN